MKLKIISFCLLFSLLFFASFMSENNSEVLPKKEVSETKIIPQKKESLIKEKKEKHSFKERLAIKLIERKIKKLKPKKSKNRSKLNSKEDGSNADFLSILLVLLASASVITGIVYLTLGNILAGILLILGGLILIPLFIILFILISIIIWDA